jgi:AcrR family transcriptional regulator
MELAIFCKPNYNDRYMKTRPPSENERPSRRQFDRAEALDTAMELFWQHGYEATSMSTLLKAMDLTAPSLYATFGNKEHLFREAVERYAQTYGAKVLAPLSAPLSAREAIEQMLLTAAATSSSSKHPSGCFISFGAVNSSDHESSPVTLLQAMRADMGRRIRERLERAVEERELSSSVDTGRLARFYYAVFGGIQLRSLDGFSRSELEAVARDAMLAWPAAPARRTRLA